MVKIKNITFENFKSLNNVSLDLNTFTCLVGLNGAGKSTILQGIDFVSQLVKGDIKSWLQKRGWNSGNFLVSKLAPNRKNIMIYVELEQNGEHYLWTSIFSTSSLRSTSETIIQFNPEFKDDLQKTTLLKVINSKFKIYHNGISPKDKMDNIYHDYEGSILSSLKEDVLTPTLILLKNFIKNISSFDLLSPHVLKQKSRYINNSLGLRGEYLATFVNNLSEDHKKQLLEKLKTCYPTFNSFSVKKIRGGWHQLEIFEQFTDSVKHDLHIRLIKTDSNDLNDGMLRLLAILSQLYTEERFLLFDEIENGINTELISFLIKELTSINHQVMITTHSPMILNYIPEDITEQAVLYVFKTQQGETQVKPFFSIPSIKEKLAYMGAGEIYVDTNLSKLSEQMIEDENAEVKKKVESLVHEAGLIQVELKYIQDGTLDENEKKEKHLQIKKRMEQFKKEREALLKKLEFKSLQVNEAKQLFDEMKEDLLSTKFES